MAVHPCPDCGGRGYFRDLEDQWSCSRCKGAGSLNGETPVHVYESLRAANQHRQTLWSGGENKTNGPLYAATELAGEVGEVCNVVKKLEREARGLPGSRTTLEKLEEEIGDVLICVDLLAIEYGIDPFAAAAKKFNKTSEALNFPVLMRVPAEC